MHNIHPLARWIATSTTIVLTLGIFTQSALADTSTYTEDFSSSTYFNTDSTTDTNFNVWVDGARAMYDTTHAVPSPFIYRHSGGGIKNSALVADDYIYTAYTATSSFALLHYFNTTTSSWGVLDVASGVDANMNEMYYDATNDYLYLTWGNSSVGGLTVVNVSDPENPSVLGTATGLPNAQYLTVDETAGQLYVVSNGTTPKLTVFEVNSGTPSVLGDLELDTGTTYTHVVKHPNGDSLLVGGSNAFNPIVAVDVSDPANPVEATFSGDDFGMNSIADMRMENNYLFAIGKNGSNEPVAKLFRVYAVLQVLEIDEYTYDSSLNPRYMEQGIDTVGETIYYTYSDATTYHQLDVFTVNTFTPEFDPEPIVQEGETAVGSTWSAEIVFAENAPTLSTDTVYIPHISLGLIAIDVNNEATPGTAVETLSVGGSAVDVVINASSAYVANQTSETIQRVSITDPTSLSVAQTVSTSACGGPTRIIYSSDEGALLTACETAYTYDELTEDGLSIPDVIETGDTVNDIEAAFGNVYLAHNAGLSVFGITSATQVGSTIGGIGIPTAIAIQGNYAYLVSNTGVHVFDLSTPNSPSLIRSFNPQGTQFDVDVDGEYVYVVGNQIKAMLISELIDENTTPTIQSFNSQNASRITVEDGYAHLGANGQAADEYQLINVRDPENMTQVSVSEDLQSGNLGAGIALTDGWVLQADGSDILAIHMAMPYNSIVESTIVDSTSTQITSVDYTFSQTVNSGQVRYYVSNNNGANWYFVGVANNDNDVVGSYSFGSTGSKLRWRAILYTDTDEYATGPTVTNAELAYTFNNTLVPDTTGPSVALTPSAGSYAGPQTVSMVASEEDSTIYYTLDGSTPNTSSTVYNEQTPLQITSTTIVSAVAVDASNNAGSVSTGTYTIGSTTDTEEPSSMVDPGSFTGADGPFSAPFSVSLVCEDNIDQNATIRYTLDGSTPGGDSTVFMSPVAISEDTVLTFRCFDAAGNIESPANAETYSFGEEPVTDTTAPVSVIEPPSGTYPSGTSISISVSDDFDSSPTIYYTLDGSTPSSTNGFVYATPFAIFTDRTVRFFAVDAAGNAEAEQRADYIIGTDDEELETPPTEDDDPALDPGFVPDEDAPSIEAEPAGGTYNTPQTVQLLCNDGLDPNATIYYTKGLSISTLVYNEPIVVTEDVTIRAYCIDASDNRSETIIENYIITNTVTDTAAPTSLDSCPASGYFGDLEIQLEADDDNDANPAIYFSIDGTAPIRLAAFTYLRPIRMSSRTTLKYFSQDASGNSEEIQTVDCKVYDPNAYTLIAKNKKKGKGTVRIANKKNGNVLKSFQAFKKGGVKAEIVNVGGVKRVAAIQFKKSKLLKLFDLNGNLLGKKKFRNKKAIHKLKAGNLYKGTANGEIIVTQLNKTTGEMIVRAFTVGVSNKPRMRAKTTITSGTEKLVAKGYRLQIKKKTLRIKTLKGKKAVIKMKLLKKGGKFTLKEI